jgi:hypothetical protein
MVPRTRDNIVACIELMKRRRHAVLESFQDLVAEGVDRGARSPRVPHPAAACAHARFMAVLDFLHVDASGKRPA